MRFAGLRSLLFVAVAVVMTGAFAGCVNPFDPVNSSDEIQGLAYFDFAAEQAHWDADQEWDGLLVTLSYFNDLSEQISFHDKSTKVQIEFWSEAAGATTGDPSGRGKLLTTKTVEVTDSDDVITIPIEFYASYLPLPSTTPITGCLFVRLFPPQEYPQKELDSLQCGVEFFTPEDVILTTP